MPMRGPPLPGTPLPGSTPLRRGGDLPLVPVESLPRLPAAIGVPSWSTLIGSEEGGSDVELAVADTTVVALSGAQRSAWSLDALNGEDGTIRWRVPLEAERARLVGLERDRIVVRVIDDMSGPAGRLRWFDVADGTERSTDDAGTEAATEPAAGAALTAFGVLSHDPDTVIDVAIRSADDAPASVVDAVDAIASGTTSVVSASEVAVGRLVVLAGGRLVGVRTSDGRPFTARSADTELIAEWSRPGVLLLSAPSERGATLLVSNRSGNQQHVVDAATGLVVVEVVPLASWTSAYTPVADGVIIKRPGLVGSALAAIDLDGRERWRILGTPAFAVGDGLVVTASNGPDGLTVSAFR